MTNLPLIDDLQAALSEMPKFDVHTHLAGGRLGAADYTICCCTTW